MLACRIPSDPLRSGWIISGCGYSYSTQLLEVYGVLLGRFEFTIPPSQHEHTGSCMLATVGFAGNMLYMRNVLLSGNESGLNFDPAHKL